MPEDNASTTERQLDATLEALVAAAAPGDRLPSVRELMARHRVAPGTVQRAVARLAARGLVEARPGRGTFVLGPPPAAARAGGADLSWQTVALGSAPASAEALQDLLRPAPPGAYVLSTGYLPRDLQPAAALARGLGRAARRPGSWDRVPVEGAPDLRAWFAADAGGAVSAGDVLVCPGGQSALVSALRGLARPGGPLLVEAPTYLGVLVAARAAGLEPVPVPADGDGVRPDHLADALERTGARAVYLQPTFANPHGSTLARHRRAAVLEAVRAAGAFLIEDDPFRDLALGAPPPPPLLCDDADGHVVALRSLTKPAAPGLRVAALIARGPAFSRLRAARIVDDFYVSGVLQEAALELVASPAWPRHLQRVRAALRERRDALLAALAADAPHIAVDRVPAGGMHAWARLPAGTDETAAVAAAARADVVVFPGAPHYAGEPPEPRLRLTFAAEPPARIAEAVRALSRAVPPS